MRSWNLGIEELSGLGLRRDPRSGSTELLAVGDRSSRIVAVGLDGDGPAGYRHRAATHHRVRGLDDGPGRGDGSQWEGVAGDADGRVLVLVERRSELLVISPDFRFERRIALRHEGRDDHHGLESLLLLRDGHVLSATQRDPAALLEFGPAGAEPIGLSPTTVLPAGEPVRLAPVDELRCLATWPVTDDSVRSVNDLAAHGGFLYLVSSTSRRLARIALPLAPGRPVLVDDRRPLPRSVVGAGDGGARAEGLVVADRLGIVVGVDSRHDRDNLHLLGRSWAELPW